LLRDSLGALPTPNGYARYLLPKYFWNTGQLPFSRMCCVMESPKNTSSYPCGADTAQPYSGRFIKQRTMSSAGYLLGQPSAITDQSFL